MQCLIVEDDPILSFTFQETLEDMGHAVALVATLDKARHSLLRRKYDLILLDYRLPDGNSTDFSSYAALTQPNCRIILLTGIDVFVAGEHGQVAPGIDWVLRKPVPLADLRALVDYAALDAQSHPTVNQTAI